MNAPLIVPFINPIPNISIVLRIEKPKPKQQEYTIVDGDRLETIAATHNSSIQRLFDKNTAITNPDLIKPGDVIVVPPAEETLTHREMPVFIPTPVIPALVQSAVPVTPVTKAAQYTDNYPDNTYTAGNCTYYAKSRRPDLPNNLGNADTWYGNAQAQGFSVGSKPQVGAVAAAKGYMHVAIVTAIVDNNTIQVTEMNYEGLGVISSRNAPASEFRYIY